MQSIADGLKGCLDYAEKKRVMGAAVTSSAGTLASAVRRGGRPQHIVAVRSGKQTPASNSSYREIGNAGRELRRVLIQVDGSDVELPSDYGGFLDGVVAVLAFEVAELDAGVELHGW